MIDILQCDPDCGPGNLAPYLNDRQLPWRLIRLDSGAPLPQNATATILLGGRMGVHDDREYPFLSPLKVWLKEETEKGTPILGICLGGQLLAHVLGGEVTSNARGELGIHEVELTNDGRRDPFFSCLPSSFLQFQWHNDTFDPPHGSPLLASSSRCAGQAFRCGNAVGLQFHPEVDLGIVTTWCKGMARGEEILAGYRERADELRQLAYAMYDNFFCA